MSFPVVAHRHTHSGIHQILLGIALTALTTVIFHWVAAQGHTRSHLHRWPGANHEWR